MEFQKILVPVIGTETDDEAIKLACRLAKKTKGKIWAVYVITVRRVLPLDTEIDPEITSAEEILSHAEIVAEEEDYQLETDLLQAREAGPTIVDEAVERKVDLIVNTPSGRGPKKDQLSIRRSALESGIPCITTIQGAVAVLGAIESIMGRSLTVNALQDYHHA